MALALARDYTDHMGEPAVGSGWLQRARRFLAGLPESEEHAWLRFREGELALFEDFDAEEVRRAGRDTARIARRVGSFDAEMLGIALEGLALVTSGELDEGMARLDEASTAVVAGEVEELAAAAEACCLMIFACERVQDFDRAAQWCERMEEVAKRIAARSALALCRAHYAAVLLSRGDWSEAEKELESAVHDLAETYPGMLPEALVRFGELRRRQGRLDEAEELFRRAEPRPEARIGLARIALDRGSSRAALDGLQTTLRHLPEADATTRAAALEVLVEACVQAGEVTRARDAVERLDRVSRRIDTPPVRAAAERARGLVAEAEGEQGRARRAFHDAVHLMMTSDMPWETARARLELARSLYREGRNEEADREAALARKALGFLGDEDVVERLGRVIAATSKGEPSPAGAVPEVGGRSAGSANPAPVTSREVEVLELVADGLTNREIAERLFISEHTVHRHIANILRKLRCSSRAQAVAAAFRRDLL